MNDIDLARSFPAVRSVALLLLLVAVCPARLSAEVAFEVVEGEQSGLRQIIQAWHDAELELHGGKFPSHGWWPWGLSAIDIDNDGAPDLVPSHHGRPGGLVLRNEFKDTGSLTFTNVTSKLGIESRELTHGIGNKTIALDLNGDGWHDIIGIRSPHYLNNGQGTAFTSTGGEGMFSFHPRGFVDAGSDRFPSLLSNSSQSSKPPQSLDTWNDEKQKFESHPYEHPLLKQVPETVKQRFEEQRRTVRFWNYSVMGDDDLNGDGLPDLVLSGFAGYSDHPLSCVLFQQRDGSFVEATAESGLPEDSTVILIADLDGDGHADVINSRGTRCGVYLSDGRGRFALAEQDSPLSKSLAAAGPYLHRAWAVDFDADGDMDLVILNPRFGRVTVFEQLAPGKFVERLKLSECWDSAPVELCDLNCDGLPDLAVGGPRNTITLYLNRSKPLGNYCNVWLRADKPNTFAAGAWIDVYRAGEASQPTAKPYMRHMCWGNGFPIFIGMGQAKEIDVRVRFLDAQTKDVVVPGLAAQSQTTITPAGKQAATGN